MTKIVVPQPLGFYPDQIKKIQKLGQVRLFNDMAASGEEWLERVKGADVICTGKFGLKQKIYELENVFLALPFVGVGWIDRERAKQRKIIISNAPGCNKDAVSEWIIFMLLSLFRNFHTYLNNNSLIKGSRPQTTLGLPGKKATVLGKGNIGSRVGNLCKVFDMKVEHFLRGDDLLQSIKDADVVIDCLSHNSTTAGLLNSDFFQGLKRQSFFITVTSEEIWDANAMIAALDQGLLAGAATDAASIQFGDVHDPWYQKFLNHPKLLVTPHIAHNSDVTDRIGNDMIIENIKAWLGGKPINLIN